MKEKSDALDAPSISKWDVQTNWNLLLPPSRPSIDHLAYFEAQLTKADRNMPVAVMGSTPEFCDLLTRLCFKHIEVIDKSRSFYEQSQKLRTLECQDTFICCDWQEHFATTEGRYCAILSDLTLGNIAYDQREQFYSSLSRALTQDGIFVSKVLTNEDGLETLNSLASDFLNLPLNLQTVNDFSCRFYFTSELIAHGIVDTTAIYEQLNDPDLPGFIRSFNQHAIMLTPIGHVWHYGRSWQIEEVAADAFLEPVTSVLDRNRHCYQGRLRLITYRRRTT